MLAAAAACVARAAAKQLTRPLRILQHHPNTAARTTTAAKTPTTMPPSLSPTTTVTDDDHHVDVDHDDDGRTTKSSTNPSSSPSLLPYLNDPTLRAPVNVHASSSSTEGGVLDVVEERDRQIVAAARAVCPGFFPLDVVDEKATVRTLSGGLSNALFVVSTTAPDVGVPPFVLARVHFDQDDGDSSPADALVDREREVGIMCHLSKSGLAPQMYGRFGNGRIEEFYHSAKPLSPSAMKDDLYWTCIAREMGRFHRHTGVPPMKDGGGGAECWDKIDGWFALASQLLAASDGNADARLDRLDVDGTMSSEWRWLKGELTVDLSPERGEEGAKSEAVRFARQVVFCHMDCQSLNILVPSSGSSSSEASETDTVADTPGSIRFIDFEYAGYNPRAADIANTFCECCDMNDLTADWTTQYPTPTKQDEFLRAYVRTVDRDLALRLDGEESSSWGGFLAELRDEVGRHAMISHLGWAVWSVVQAVTSPIEFDFVAYAEQRMDGYRYFKDRYYFGHDQS